MSKDEIVALLKEHLKVKVRVDGARVQVDLFWDYERIDSDSDSPGY